MIKGFADIVIAYITAGQINHYFAEIVPRTVYPLYGTYMEIMIHSMEIQKYRNSTVATKHFSIITDT